MQRDSHGEKEYSSILFDIRNNIRRSQYLAARSVNKHIVLLYFAIGSILHRKVNEREWGSKVLSRISSDIK